ncbi:MAG: DUF3450 domain-containing protein [Kangiellaceae bacterium]|jgi:hypothetical protein|nr:DUF3450 domain-containing protein [Kangiellaceae bacterium]
MLNSKITRILVAGLATIMGLGSNSVIAEGKLEPSVNIETRIDKKQTSVQKRINRLAEQTMDMSQEYKSLLTRIEQFKAYNKRLELSIAEQKKEMDSIQNQMNTIDDTERGLMPLMDEMITYLYRFVELDMPFQQEDRLDRVERLKTTMLRADVSVSEKYRQILGAYTDEISFGTSVTVYEGKADVGGSEKQVDFLQFGRTALMFATRGDNKQAFIYAQNGWQQLSGEMVDAVNKAIRDIRLKSKKLIVVPVATPENV